jgi:hypothetical protein
LIVANRAPLAKKWRGHCIINIALGNCALQAHKVNCFFVPNLAILTRGPDEGWWDGRWAPGGSSRVGWPPKHPPRCQTLTSITIWNGRAAGPGFVGGADHGARSHSPQEPPQSGTTRGARTRRRTHAADRSGRRQ